MDASEKHHLKSTANLFEECSEPFFDYTQSLLKRLICDNTIEFANCFTEVIRLLPDLELAPFDGLSVTNEAEENLQRRTSEVCGDSSSPLVACSGVMTIDSTKANSMIHRWKKKHRLHLTQEEEKSAIHALIGVAMEQVQRNRDSIIRITTTAPRGRKP